MIPEALYVQIVRSMPIACVDLLVENREGKVLLVRRANEPAKGEWWFPGGRILYKETRIEAAMRKLQEECGLKAQSTSEIGTFDVLLQIPGGTEEIRHGITTVFHIKVNGEDSILLDRQSSDSNWRLPPEWLTEKLHGFVRQNLIAFSKKIA